MQTLKQQIKTFAQHGGPWCQLENRFINEGASQNIASLFVKYIRKELSKKNSDIAVKIYEYWESSSSEKEVESFLLALNSSSEKEDKMYLLLLGWS